MSYLLDPKLATDSSWIIDLPLCQVRLHHNAAFPWLLLIPQQAGLIEWCDLTSLQQTQLSGEIHRTCQISKMIFKADKLNIANIGNKVTQFHIHVIARYFTDPAWPEVVWNSGKEASYSPLVREQLCRQLARAFKEQQNEANLVISRF